MNKIYNNSKTTAGLIFLTVVFTLLSGAVRTLADDFIYAESDLYVDIPASGDWAGSGIQIDTAPPGATVTSVDVHYEIKSSTGFVYAELSDQDYDFTHGLVDGVNGPISQTRTGITTFNGRPVNQIWVLWAREEYSSGGGYIFSWWIKVYYYSGPPTYCSASGSCVEHISRVEVGTIDNSSDCDGYADYTAISTEMQIGTGSPITVTNGYPYASDECGIWVDWNQDMVFDVVEEAITVSVNPGVGPYTATITPPADAKLGDTRMRIRIIDSGYPPYSLAACGTSSYGEVEDYTITVAAAQQALMVSGYVKTEGGTAIEEVLMTGTNGAGTDTTDGNGFYELTLPTNPWTGTITPSKACWSFDPASRGYSGLNYDVTEANFTGTGTCFYGGGLGSQQNPFLIDTAEHMQEIGTHPDHWDMCFKLMADIDLSGYPLDTFNIIGYYIDSFDNEPFSGIFDGNDHTIYNFTYSITGTYNIGIFGYVSGFGAKIKNLGLVNPVITGSGTVVGALVGWSSNATINNCYVAGGSVSGDDAIGGLVGQVGFFGNTTINNCYTNVAVSGNDDVGGLAGWVFDGTISNCYSAGSVSGTGSVGGLIGDNQDTIENSFWDTEASGQMSGVGAGSSSGASGKTTEQMQMESTYTDAGWDFTTPIWKMCDCGGYPQLEWELDQYGGGHGTSNEPYLICTAEHMQAIGSNTWNWDKEFLLMEDIDLSVYTSQQFNVIGTDTERFNGTFEGQGFSINNFSYLSKNHNFVGIFGCIGTEGLVKNLRLKDTNIYFSGGGVISGAVGGLAGSNKGTILNCSNSGFTSGSYSIGGLVGANNGTILQSFSKTTVRGELNLGSLAGFNSGTIDNCYATGSVAGNSGPWADKVGGLVGYNNGAISKSYSTGSTSGEYLVGGFVGSNTGTITDCFWDKQTSNKSNMCGGGSCDDSCGKTTTQMQDPDTYLISGWDFWGESDNGTDDIWRLCPDVSNYPKLLWEYSVADFVCPDGVEFNDLDVFVKQWLMEKLSADVAPPDGDGIVDFADWTVFAKGWQDTIDLSDVAVFADQWLRSGAYCADIAPPPGGDGVVDMLDFAVFSQSWLAGLE